MSAAAVDGPAPTRLVLAVGPTDADALAPLVRGHLRELGDRDGRIEVVVSPFPADAHSVPAAPCGEGPADVVLADEDFRAWAADVASRPPESASLVWVFWHLERAVAGLVRLARDPDTHYLVLDRDPDNLAYMGSSVGHLSVGPLTTGPQRDAVAAAIAVEVLFRFPTPAQEPILPWAALARLNYQAQPSIPAPPPAREAGAAVPRQRLSADGRWAWDGRHWGPHVAPLPPAPPQTRDASLANGSRNGRWRLPGRAAKRPEPPIPQRDVQALIPSHAPLTIVVTGAKGGVGKSSLCAGLLLAARDAAPAGMPLLAVDCDPNQAHLSRLLGVQGNPEALWESVVRHRSGGDFVPPATSDSQVYVYEQGGRVRDLPPAFDASGAPVADDGLRRFMDRVRRQYQIVVVDASVDRDLAFLWSSVADAVVVATDASPLTVVATQQLIGQLLRWRGRSPSRAQLPVACAWISAFDRVTPEVRQRRGRIENGSDMILDGEHVRVDGVPVVLVPWDRRAHDTTDHAGLRRSRAMTAYRRLFALLVKSVGPARMRVS